MMARYSCLRAFTHGFLLQERYAWFLATTWSSLFENSEVAYAAGAGGTIWKYRWLLLGLNGRLIRFSCACGFWIDRQRVKKIYPLRGGLRECWRSVCRITAVRHPLYISAALYIQHQHSLCATNDPESIDNIRGAPVLSGERRAKDGLCAYGCNEVPERPAAGRPS